MKTKLQFSNWNFKKSLLALALALLSFSSANAQSFITFPTAPQDITACNGSSLLAVKVSFGATSVTGGNIAITLPTGIEYVPGSVAKTASMPATIGITENGGTPGAPIFAVSGPIALNNSITFTIARSGTCVSRTQALASAPFQDKVTVEVGTPTSKTSANYTVLFPSLSLAQPASQTDAVINTTYTRNFTITNGAIGCADAVHFTIERPSATTTLVSLMLGATTITPTSTVGDISYFTITGADLTADQQLCFGESLTFTEEYRFNTCENSTNTNYSIGWGCSPDPASWCQTKNGVGAIATALGVADFSAHTNTKIDYVDLCTPFTFRSTFTNGGSGDATAATMYNLRVQRGDRGGSAVALSNLPVVVDLSNPTVGGQSIPLVVSGSGSALYTMDLENHFPVSGGDPDGVGVGLEDVDGDGFYDDLPSGNTLSIDMLYTYDCARDSSCGSPQRAYDSLDGRLFYEDMCTSAIASTARYATGDNLAHGYYSFAPTGYAPANIENATPFRVRFSVGYYRAPDSFKGPNSKWQYILTLPPGVTVSGSGNPTWVSGQFPNNNTEVATTFTQVGNEVTITSPGTAFGFGYIDLVYDCSAGGDVSIPYQLKHINNTVTGCECRAIKACGTFDMAAACPGPCPLGGPAASIPTVRRADNSLGWTDRTLTTRQSASNINAFDLSKALYLDEIEIYGNALQNGDNDDLFIHLDLPSAGTIAKLTPLNVDVTIIRAGAVIASATNLTTFTSAVASGSQVVNWDLSSILPGGVIRDGDEIETISRYQVATNNLPQQDIQSGGNWYFYNLDAANNELFCRDFVPEMYLVGTSLLNGHNAFVTTGCAAANLGGSSNYLARRFNTSGAKYQDEFRPSIYVESMVVTMPPNDVLNNATFQLTAGSYGGVNPAGFNISPTSVVGNVYTFTNPGPGMPGEWPALDMTVTNTYGAYMVLNASATCASLPVEPIGIIHNINDYYYHTAGTVPFDTSRDFALNGSTSVSHRDKPNTSLADQTGVVQAAAPTENWVVRIESDGASAAPYTWLAIPDVANVTITQIVDVATSAAITPIPYAGGTMYHIDAAGLPVGSFKDYRIDFTYNTCNQTDVKVYGGWNCTEFPADLDSYPCSLQEVDLRFVPVNSEVEVISVSEPSGTVPLCDSLPYEYNVNSSQAANTVDNTFSIIPSSGMLPETGTFEVNYPVGSSNWEPAAAVVSGGVYTYDLTNHSNYPAEGLPGTLKDGGDSNARLIGVRFNMTTDCDFVAGANFQVETAGNRPCGQPADGDSVIVQTKNIIITGVGADYIVVNDIAPISGSFNNCGSPVTLDASHTIVGSDTGSNGFVEVRLPLGYTYVPGSFNCTSATCVNFASVTPSAAAGDVIKLLIPDATPSGEELTYTIDVRESTTMYVACGDKTINVVSIDEAQNVPCATEPSGACPALAVQTGQFDYDFEVEKPSVTLASDSTISIANANNENITANYTVTNTSTTLDVVAGTIVGLYFDANGDSLLDAGDVLLATETLSASIPASGSATGSITTLNLDSPKVCSLLLVVSTNDNFCICAGDIKPVVSPSNIQSIAGEDQTACQFSDSVELGTTPNVDYTYVWTGATATDDIAYLGATATSAQPTFTYSGPDITAPTTFTYQVEITRVGGCKSTDTVDVTVIPAPDTPVIASSDLDVCSLENLSVTFSNTLATDETVALFTDAGLTIPAVGANSTPSGVWISQDAASTYPAAGNLYAVIYNSTTECSSESITMPYTVTVCSAELVTVKSVTPTNPSARDTVTYTITVENEGPNADEDVVLEDNLPAGVTYNTSTATVGSYDSVTGVWTIGDLPVITATLTITATVDMDAAGTSVVNTTTAAKGKYTDETKTSDDVLTATITVPDLVILATDDDYSGTTVNGSDGNPNLGNILTGTGDDTLNGDPITNANVAISYPTATPATVDGNPIPAGNSPVISASGDVSVPAGTPAGTYSIPYTICEIANPDNCDDAVITVVVDPPAIVATDDDYSATPVNSLDGSPGTIGNILAGTGDDTLNGDPTNINEVDITLDAAGMMFDDGTGAVAATGTIPVVDPTTGDVSVPAGTPAGTYTIDYTICEELNPTNCSMDATVTVVVEAPIIVAEDDSYDGINSLDGDTAVGNIFTDDTGDGLDTLDGDPIVPADVNATLTSAMTFDDGTGAVPATGTIPNVDPTTGVVSVPMNTPAGTYTIDYQICDTINTTVCDDATVEIVVDPAPIVANDDDYTATPVDGLLGGVVPGANVLGDDTLNGDPVDPVDVVITSTPTAELIVNSDGSVEVLPGTPSGEYTIEYTICEVLNPNNCSTAEVTVKVDAAIIAEDDDFTGTGVVEGTVGSVLDNALTPTGDDTLNGTVVTIADVIISIDTPATPLTPGASVPVLDIATGEVSIPSGTPEGTYTIDYTICEEGNPTNCDPATVTVLVAPPAIVANDDTFPDVNSVDGGDTPSVLLDDTLNGDPVNPADIELTPRTAPTPTEGSIVMNPDGTITIEPGTTPGTYTYPYLICEKLNDTNCNDAIATIVVVSPEIEATDDDYTANPVNGLSGNPTVGNILTTENGGGADTLNGDPATTTNIVITIDTAAVSIGGAPVPLVDPATGIVSVPAGTPADTYTIEYTICDTITPAAGNCDSATVTVVVEEAPIVAEDDVVEGGNGLDGNPDAGNVFDDNDNGSDTLNGSPTDISQVDITVDTPAMELTPGAPVPSVDPATGTISVPAGTPAGDYTIEYTICETLNPTNCDPATVTVTVDPAPIDAIDNDYTATPINGTDGGDTPSVLVDDTLNDVILDPADINLTAGTSPDAGLLMNPDGTITVSADTPAGTYVYPYTICEKLNPTNCDTAEAIVVVEAAEIDAVEDDFTATPINGTDGGDTPSVLVDDTLNGTVVDPTDITLTPGASPEDGLTMNPDGTITVDPGTPAGSYEYPYTICEKLNPTNCDTTIATVLVEEPEILAEDNILTTPVNGLEGVVGVVNVFDNDTLNGTPVDPADVILTEITADPTGALTLNGDGTVDVAPGTPAGVYELTYTICEKLNPLNCDEAVVSVVVEEPAIVANDDTFPDVNSVDGGDTPSVLLDDTLNGDPVDPADVNLTPGTAPTPTDGSIVMNPDGTVTIEPGTTPGTYTYPYVICEKNNPTNCNDAIATIVVAPAVIEATDDDYTASPVSGLTGDTPIGNILTTENGGGADTLNGDPATTTNVVITIDTAATSIGGAPVPFVDPATGIVSVPAGTPADTYTIEYTICDTITPAPGNCSSATVTVVVEEAPIVAEDDVVEGGNGLDGNPDAGNVLNDNDNGQDTLNGVSTDITEVDINVTTPASPLTPGAPVPSVDPATGIVSVPAGTPAGDYVIEYTICEILNPTNCDPATVTVTVDPAPIDAIDNDFASTPINGTDGGDTPSVLVDDTLNGIPVDPTDIVLTPGTSPNPGLTMNPDGTITVDPNTPAGEYVYEYTICEVLNPTNCDTAEATVVVEAAEIDAVEDDFTATPINGTDGGNTPSVLLDDTLNGAPVDPADIVLTPGTSPEDGLTMNPDGTITVAPGTPAGTYVYPYTICEKLNPTNCDTTQVTVVVEAAEIVAVDNAPATPVNGEDGQVGVVDVFDNDTLNGQPIVPSEVNLTLTTADPEGALTLNGDGTVDVAPGTPAGTYELEYTICEKLNPSNCATAIVTVIVESSTIVAQDDDFSGTPVDSLDGNPNVGNVLTDNGAGEDTLNGNPAEIDDVTLTVTTPAVPVTPGASVPVIDPSTGTVSVPAGTPAGTYVITYTICEELNTSNCDEADLTVVVESSTIDPANDLIVDVDGFTGTPNVGNILSDNGNGSDTLNGVPVIIDDVTISILTPATPLTPGAPVPTVDPITGIVSVPAGTPGGSYDIEYQICEILNPTNCETAIVTVVVKESADLSIIKVVDVASPNVGDTVNFTITLTNDGLNNATGVNVVDQLPSGFTFVSATPSVGTYDAITGSWSVGSIANGANETLVMAAIVNETGNFTNTAEVTASDQEDPTSIPGNNDASEDDYGFATASPMKVIDLRLTKTVVDDDFTPAIGEEITFEIRVINDGPATATGVKVTELLPSGYDYVNYSSSIGTYDPVTGLWTIGFIEVDNTAVLLVDAIVLASGDYENCAEIIEANEADVDSTVGNGITTEDDYDCASVMPVSDLDLSIVKTVVDGNTSPNVGDVITFEILLTNNGSIDATNVEVVDNLLPLSYTFVNYSSTKGNYDETTGIWNVRDIADGDTEILLIDVLVEADGTVDTYTNCTTITGLTQTDNNPANDTSCIALTPIQTIDLELTKDVDNLKPEAESNVNFTINLINQGPSTATGVQVLDLLPSGYDFVSATTTVGTYDETTGLWNVGTLLNGGLETLVVTATVKPFGNWLNIAEITAANGNDIDSTPNNGDINEDDMAQVVTEPIVLLTIPEGFTPNGDGVNDVFEIENLEVLYPDFSIEVVNRYGNIVYKYKHNGNVGQSPTWWDGYSDGRWDFSSEDMLPTGTYFYTIYFNNNERKPQTGWVYLRK